MKKISTTIILVVAILIVSVFLYYYFNPNSPYLEGFAPSTDLTGVNAVATLIFLNKQFKGTDKTMTQVKTDMKGVNFCPDTTATLNTNMPTIPAACFKAMISKYEIIPGPLPTTASENIDILQAGITISTLKKIKGDSYSSFVPQTLVEDVMTEFPEKCKITTIGNSKFITPTCYNAIYSKLLTDTTTVTVPVPVPALVPAPVPALVQEPVQAPLGVTPSPSDSELDKFLKEMKDVSKTAKKCTVEFGKEVITAPQTKASQEKESDKTCTTEGDMTKDTKTAAAQQGCDFSSKFPKVNVINLRDYIHKDDIPCWGCKI